MGNCEVLTMSTFIVEMGNHHRRMIEDLKQQCCALIEDVCHKAEILENIAAEPWELAKDHPPPKDGSWILGIFKHEYHPGGLPVVVRWREYEIGGENLPDGTQLPDDDVCRGWALAGGYPCDQVCGEPIVWSMINVPTNLFNS